MGDVLTIGEVNEIAAPDLFWVMGSTMLYRLDAMSWPSSQGWLVNRFEAHIGDLMVTKLQASTRPLVIAGFTAIATIVDVLDR